jgi:hypothetical protein
MKSAPRNEFSQNRSKEMNINEEKEMTQEMIDLATSIFNDTRRYKELYVSMYGKTPVAWIKENETQECVFIADSFNSQRIVNFLS